MFSKGQVVETKCSHHCLEEEENEQSDLFLGTVDCMEDGHWVVPFVVSGTSLTLKLDTGARANLINMRDFHELKHKPFIMQRLWLSKPSN